MKARWRRPARPSAIAPASGRDRLNIHGALNLETGQTQMLEVAAAIGLSGPAARNSPARLAELGQLPLASSAAQSHNGNMGAGP